MLQSCLHRQLPQHCSSQGLRTTRSTLSGGCHSSSRCISASAVAAAHLSSATSTQLRRTVSPQCSTSACNATGIRAFPYQVQQCHRMPPIAAVGAGNSGRGSDGGRRGGRGQGPDGGGKRVREGGSGSDSGGDTGSGGRGGSSRGRGSFRGGSNAGRGGGRSANDRSSAAASSGSSGSSGKVRVTFSSGGSRGSSRGRGSYRGGSSAGGGSSGRPASSSYGSAALWREVRLAAPWHSRCKCKLLRLHGGPPDQLHYRAGQSSVARTYICRCGAKLMLMKLMARSSLTVCASF
jgi:hypothetical protein